ncbi:MAG: NAD(P)H-binding protein [Alphaproteobacteria bacterium]|nr:NAD(P)H-binding protein [Alphaproteobacteria bacterium]
MKRAISIISFVAMAMTPASNSAAAVELVPVLVVGATAQSAPEIITQALDEGRRVTGLARSPERIKISHPNFTAARGDVYDVDSLADALIGDEVVISLIGPSYVPGKEVTSVDLYSVGTASIITAMRRKGNGRLIVTSSGGVEMIPAEKPTNGGFSENFVWMKRGQYQDMQRMERIVANSDLEYIVLRPRGFRDAPQKNNLLISDGIPTPNPSSILSYTDFATLVLSLTVGDRYLNRAIGVYTNEFETTD